MGGHSLGPDFVPTRPPSSRRAKDSAKEQIAAKPATKPGYVAGPAVSLNSMRGLTLSCHSCEEPIEKSKSTGLPQCAKCELFFCRACESLPRADAICSSCRGAPIFRSWNSSGNLTDSQTERIDGALDEEAEIEIALEVGGEKLFRFKLQQGAFDGVEKARIMTIARVSTNSEFQLYVIPPAAAAMLDGDADAARLAAAVPGLRVVEVLLRREVVKWDAGRSAFVAGPAMTKMNEGIRSFGETLFLEDILVHCYVKFREKCWLAIQFCVYGNDMIHIDDGGPGRNAPGAPGLKDATTASLDLRRARLKRRDYVTESKQIWKEYALHGITDVYIQFAFGWGQTTDFYWLYDAALEADETAWTAVDHVKNESTLCLVIVDLLRSIGYREDYLVPANVKDAISRLFDGGDWHNVILGALPRLRFVSYEERDPVDEELEGLTVFGGIGWTPAAVVDVCNESEWDLVEGVRQSRGLADSAEGQEVVFPPPPPFRPPAPPATRSKKRPRFRPEWQQLQS